MTSLFVIDDDTDARELMALLLREEGYDVLAFGDASDALRTLRGGARPDAILLDLMMPKMSGLEFCAELRRDAALFAIPLAVVSGDPLASQRATELGSTFLKKPFDVDDLVTLVQNLSA